MNDLLIAHLKSTSYGAEVQVAGLAHPGQHSLPPRRQAGAAAALELRRAGAHAPECRCTGAVLPGRALTFHCMITEHCKMLNRTAIDTTIAMVCQSKCWTFDRVRNAAALKPSSRSQARSQLASQHVLAFFLHIMPEVVATHASISMKSSGAPCRQPTQ